MKYYTKPEGSYISFMSNKVKSYGGINLAQGIPGFNPPSELLDILSNIAHQSIHQYAPGDGNHDLLERLVERFDPVFDKQDFLITNGATEAVSLLYTYLNRLLAKPYSAIAFEPVYESYSQLPRIFNDRFVSFPLSEKGAVDFPQFRETCIRENTRIVFLNTPGNPFGKVWTREEVSTLIEIAEELDMYVIVDAVYQPLYFGEEPFDPASTVNKQVFYVNSFSKIFSITGWRIGYLIASQDHMPGIKSVHDYTGLCVPSVLQQALAEFIRDYNWGAAYVKTLRERLKKSYDRMHQGLSALGFDIPDIEGGFFIWARLPESWEDGFQFAMNLYDQQKVAVIPGEHFSPSARNYVRFNIARGIDEIEEAIIRMKRFFSGE